MDEKTALFESLEKEKANLAESEERYTKLNAAKVELERQLGELSERIAEMEDRQNEMGRQHKKDEAEINELRKKNTVRFRSRSLHCSLTDFLQNLISSYHQRMSIFF